MPTSQPLVPNKTKKRNILITVFTILVLGSVAVGYALMPKNVQITDDAYVSGQQVMVTSKEPGIISQVLVDDSQRVKQGDQLIILNSNSLQLSKQRAEASLLSTIRQVKSHYIDIKQLQATLVSANTELAQAKADYKRRIGGDKDGSVLPEMLNHAKNNVVINQQNVIGLNKKLESLQIIYPQESLINNPQIQTSIAQLRQVYLAIENANIVAPKSGMIAIRSIHVGQKINAGQPLMMIVPLNHIWIDANFKETQLATIKIGQTVNITSELYGKKHIFKGIVAGINAGSGSVFSPIPAQNATGNWIKIVQRVPVRIYIDPAQLKNYPLRIGMSMTVTVNTKNQTPQPFDFKLFTATDSITKQQQQRLENVDTQVNTFVTNQLMTSK